MNVLTYEHIDVWTSERMDVQTYELLNRWLDELMGRSMPWNISPKSSSGLLCRTLRPICWWPPKHWVGYVRAYCNPPPVCPENTYLNLYRNFTISPLSVHWLPYNHFMLKVVLYVFKILKFRLWILYIIFPLPWYSGQNKPDDTVHPVYIPVQWTAFSASSATVPSLLQISPPASSSNTKTVC